MGAPQKDRPIPDALGFRETIGGEEWFVRRVPAHKLAAYLEGGWQLLISEAQVRAGDIEDTYRADRDRPFNPPRKP